VHKGYYCYRRLIYVGELESWHRYTLTNQGPNIELSLETSRQMTEAGTDVKYIRSNFYPGDASCTCIFEAIDKDAVKAVNEKAALPFDEITEVFDLVP
jgi:hypothetical protein